MECLHCFKNWIGFWSILLGLSLSTPLQAQVCSQPSNLNAGNVSSSSVTLSWSAIQGAFDYTVQYRVGSSGTWTTAAPTTGTSLTLNNLLPSTVYNWRVKASCSTYSSIASFNTGGSSGGSNSCSAPSNTNTDLVQPTSAKVSWEFQSGAFNYTVQYRLETSTAYITVGSTTSNTILISGLQPGRNYVWRVKANCSPYGSDVQFSTPVATPASANQSAQAQMTEEPVISVSIFPNPATNYVQIQVEELGLQLQVLDARGQVVLSEIIRRTPHTIDVSQFRNGFYFLRLQNDKNIIETRRFLIAR
ncbi:MAG TPA: fibronectin type III domain-containing protein [Saprospiraceae bacterium]|nr:fibronectin type III domain-containing protein [Saprospiraceae bacterium]HMP12443.1 fibronectin type III domain-containing protein [Saprospiraceae bacterium]